MDGNEGKMDFDKARNAAINNAILSMRELQKAVKLLFDAGGQKSGHFGDFPNLGPTAAQELYKNLIREEYKELMVAFDKKDPVEILDGISDLIWVAIGLGISLELPLGEAWQEVVRSNLHKVQIDGTVVKDERGKIQKPLGWTPPQISSILAYYTNTGESL